MMPMMFGEARRLYGVYHPAAGAAGAGRGVVLCNPYGQEAYRANRAYRIMADALAGARMHVLRFDYSSTGDSSCDDMAATLERWVEDVGAAVDELRAMARLRAVHLVGLRLGAAVAALTAAKRADIAGLVLWDPIVDGASYLKELLPAGLAAGRDELAGEVDGFRLPVALATGIAAIDLASLDGCLPPKQLMITAPERRAPAAVRRQLSLTRPTLQLEQIDDPPAWAEENNFGAGPVPAKTIKTVTQWYC